MGNDATRIAIARFSMIVTTYCSSERSISDDVGRSESRTTRSLRPWLATAADGTTTMTMSVSEAVSQKSWTPISSASARSRTVRYRMNATRTTESPTTSISSQRNVRAKFCARSWIMAWRAASAMG
eukprot:Amastigsp_a512892_10.p2 type:complete len:126 gc:universal Amastigsp_a512892_10:175-552(+)